MPGSPVTFEGVMRMVLVFSPRVCVYANLCPDCTHFLQFCDRCTIKHILHLFLNIRCFSFVKQIYLYILLCVDSLEYTVKDV
jgi:hypothetical protein